jgi:hypothetical protein
MYIEGEEEAYGGEPIDPEDEAVFESEPSPEVLKGWQKQLGPKVCPCHGMTNCQLQD